MAKKTYTVAIDLVAHKTYLLEEGAATPEGATVLESFAHGGEDKEPAGFDYPLSHALISHIDDIIYRKAGLHSTKWHPVTLVTAPPAEPQEGD